VVDGTEKRLTVGISKTINTGNYESVKLHTGLSMNVKDGTDLDKVYHDMFDECTKHLLEYESDIIHK